MFKKDGYAYNMFVKNSVLYITRMHLKTRTASMAEMPLQAGIEYDLDKLLQDAISDGAFD